MHTIKDFLSSGDAASILNYMYPPNWITCMPACKGLHQVHQDYYVVPHKLIGQRNCHGHAIFFYEDWKNS